MRVGYILKKFPRLSETFILNEILALEAKGVEVEIFSLKAPDEEPRHGSLDRLRASVTVIRPLAPRSIFRYLEEQIREEDAQAMKRIAHYAGRFDPDHPWRDEALKFSVPLVPLVKERGITHLHAHFATIAAATAAEVSLLTPIPFSFTMHAKDICRNTVNFDALGERMKQAAFTVTVCEANRRWLAGKCKPEAMERLHVIYNGLDLGSWNDQKVRRDKATFISVGRLVEKKGFDDFLRACALIQKTGRTFDAHLIGAGDEEERLLRLQRELGLTGCVHFTGALPQERVRELIGSSTLFVAPCVEGDDGNRDALPTVLIESMASGTPCVSTTVGGIPEMLEDGVEGWLVEPRAPERIAACMIEAMDNPDEVERRGQSALKRVERQFDIRKNVDVLRDLMNRSSGGGEECPSMIPAAAG